MKFLDQNGVLTLWNKIKSNFFSSNGGTITQKIDDSGSTISVSILPTSGATLIVTGSSFNITETINNMTAEIAARFPLTVPSWVVKYNNDFTMMQPQAIVLTNGSLTEYLTVSHGNVNEYAKPIQDLESILI